MELLKQYFPEDKFIVNDIKNTPMYKSKANKYNLEAYEVKDKTNNNCITFTIFINPETNKKGIYVKYLHKCSYSSGTNILKILEQYGIERGDVIQIDLQDVSTIYICNVVISLYYLHLLSTGSSWYNKLEYKSEDYTDELNHNQIEIQKPFLSNLYKMLDEVKNNYSNKLLEIYPDIDVNNKEDIFFKLCSSLNSIIEDVNPSLLQDAEDPFALLEPLSVQQLFTNLHNYIKKQTNNCDNKQNILIISLLVDIFKTYFTINYNSDILTKPIINKIGGKRSKSKRSKKTKRKNKRKKCKTNKKYINILDE